MDVCLSRPAKALSLGLVAVVCFFFVNCSVHADNIYLSLWNGEIEKVDSSGNVSVFADRGQFVYGPYALEFGPNGNLYVAETYQNAIVTLDSTGNESPFASGLNAPVGLAFDGSSNLYVANTGDSSIWKFNSSGQGAFFASGVGATGLLLSLACDPSGHLYESTSAGTIEKYDSSGNGSVFASGLPNASGLAFDSSGNLYVGNGNFNDGTILKFDSSGNRSVFASGLNDATGLAFDSIGGLYEVNFYGKIEKFDSSGNGTVFGSGLGETMGMAIQVPEPATWALLAFGIGAVLSGLRLRRLTNIGAQR